MPRAESASVVTQLSEFLNDPARHRPRYTHGREVLTGGRHVFRFAQGKFPAGLLHDTPTHRRDELQRAAAAFVRQVCFWEGATHYQVLCVDPGAPHDTIKDHYHLLMALIHPDRSAGSGEAFPASWAQRANQAYAALSDARLRADYDGEIAISAKAAAAFAYPRGASGRPRSGRAAERRKLRNARIAIAATGLVATLLLVQVWDADTPHEHSLFAGLGNLARKAELPRYLGSVPPPTRAALQETVTPAPLPALPAPKRASHEPAPLPPVEERDAPVVDVPVPPPIAITSRPFIAAPPALLVAQSESREAKALPAPTSEEIEILVVRLIGYYEAGEADRLMSLVASDAGYWTNARIRQSYSDFFRATRERHLRVQSLQWEKAPGSAHAHGEAMLEARYVDDSPGLDRRVSVDLEIALRDGEAKITRLSLYPHAP